MGTPRDSEKTRAKLIEVAGKLFAERGINGVTVRDIAREAKKPLSAINYHFRTKEALYREVLLEACRQASLSPKEQELLRRSKPRDALYLLVSESLKLYREQTAGNWQNIILTRECWEPSPVFAEIAEKYFKPETEFLSEIVGKIVDKPAGDHQVRFSVIVLIGLIDTFGFYTHFVDAVAPGLYEHLRKRNLLARALVQTVIEVASATPELSTSVGNMRA